MQKWLRATGFFSSTPIPIHLFYYVYVLSFFERAKGDARFAAAHAALASNLNGEGEIVVERPHRGLKGPDFCASGKPSKLATERYGEIDQNVDERSRV